MSELDDELDRARQQSQARFRDAFEAIFAKYGHIDDEDDIIDLETGKLIVDNGRMRNAKVISLGDLLYSPDHASPNRQRKRHRGLTFHSIMPDSAAMSSSPELLSNGQKQSLETKHQHNSDYSNDSDSNESDFVDLDFGSHSKYAPRLQRRSIDTENSDNNGLSADYESSDSTDAFLDSPLDAYFTSSVENYLERLRQQITSSEPANDALSSSSEPSASTELFNIANGLHSSPHTMSSADLNRPNNNQMWTDYEYISESPVHISETTNDDPLPLHPHHAFTYEDGGDVSEEEPLESYEFRRYNLQSTFQPQPAHYRSPSPAVLFKPQPISPHAFFDFDIRAAKPYSPEEDDDDDNASIHSGEQLHTASYDLHRLQNNSYH
ncbi:hypothetical protein EV183_003413 [Coemansia sp. RSA 2336]|nr:hypothetical protein EV183_003413 [Coemansia sp. RSA 2336]